MQAPLPRNVVSGGAEHLIDQLRRSNSVDIPAKWSESEWLNGEMFVMLDDELQATVDGKMIRYDEKMGMMTIDS